MPALKFCNHPGCHIKVAMGVKFCPEHQNMERANQEREVPFFVGYKRKEYDHLYHSSRWKELCKEMLSLHPECELCGDTATDVHHKTKHLGNEDLFWDRNNLMCLCKQCHDGISADERREARRNNAMNGCQKPKVKELWY